MKKFGNNCSLIEPPVPQPREPLCMGSGPFRPNVAALILRRGEKGGFEILAGERVDSPGAWQWPQGGLEPGESPEVGLNRELAEEIGVTKPKVRYRFPFLLRYRFPISLGPKFAPNLGQDQQYFIVTLDEGDPPNLDHAETEEFSSLTWLPLEASSFSTVWFKQPTYRHAVGHAVEVLPRLAL